MTDKSALQLIPGLPIVFAVMDESRMAGTALGSNIVGLWGKLELSPTLVLGLCIVEALLIVALLVQRSRRARAEEHRRLSEEKFSKAFRASPDALAIIRRSDGVIVEVNDQWETLLGYSREEAVGHTALELRIYSNPADRTEFFSIVESKGSAHDFETDFRCKDGEIRRVNASAELITINKIRNLIIIIQDITERRRAEEQIILLQTITMEVAAARDLSAALEVVMRRVCERTGWVFGQIWIPRVDGTVLDCSAAWLSNDADLEEFRITSRQINFFLGEGLPGRAWSSKQPVWVRDVTLDSNFPRAEVAQRIGLKAALAIPILSDEKVIAVIEFFLRDPRHEDERLVKAIVAVASQLNLVIKRKQAEQELRRLTGQLIYLRDEEQRRIAAELHDGLGQSLSIIRNRATLCKEDIGDQESVLEQLEEISASAVSAIEEVREIAHNLRPYELDRLGLVAAVDSMVGKILNATAIHLSSDLDQIDGLLSPAAETSVYRIVQEGLNNMIKHAEASEARVGIKRIDSEIVVSIADNGKGIDPQAASADGKNGGGFGLNGIAERARMLGGVFSLDSQPGRGTVLTVRVALEDAA